MKGVILDFETWGDRDGDALQPWSVTAYPTVFVALLADIDSGHVIDKVCLTDNFSDGIKEFIERGRPDFLAAYNAVFDAAWMVRLGLTDLIHKHQWVDVLVAAKMADNCHKQYLREKGRRTSYSLKQEVRERLPEFAGYEDDVDYAADKGSEAFDKLVTYAKIDVAATLKLLRIYFDQFDLRRMRHLFQVSAAVPHLAYAWYKGIDVDYDGAKALHDDALKAMAEIEQTLGVPADVLRSPAKLSHLVYTEWGLPLTRMTETGQPSVSVDALAALKDDRRVNLILAYSKLQTVTSKFTSSIIEGYEYNVSTRRVHPSPFIYSTYTGRITYASNQKLYRPTRTLPTGIAIHQWSPLVRHLLRPPEGYGLVELDFSGQEMRLMADFSQDPTMMSIFTQNLDGHSLMASRIYGVDYDDFVAQKHTPEGKARRQVGKLANLSLQYRTGAKTLKTRALSRFGLDLSMDQAKRIVSTYYDTYPMVKAYQQRAVEKAYSLGYAESAGGGRVALEGEEDSWRRESTAINYPIQATGADMKYLAIQLLTPVAAAYYAKFAWDLHDGLYWHVPRRAMEPFIKDAKDILKQMNFFDDCGEPILKLDYPVDAKMGSHWGDLKEIEL